MPERHVRRDQAKDKTISSRNPEHLIGLMVNSKCPSSQDLRDYVYTQRRRLTQKLGLARLPQFLSVRNNTWLQWLSIGPGITPGARLTRLSFLSTEAVTGRAWAGWSGKVSSDREETRPPLTKEQIEGHVSALKSLIKSHNQKNKGDPIRLDFETKDIEMQEHSIAKGRDVVDEDLIKPFKEAHRTSFTRRIIEFAGQKYQMPTNIKLYDGTTDPKDHLSRFAGEANSGEWPMRVWCRMFQQTLDGPARG
ncbi:hypothetical protein Tco_0537345 [Tanacetum coccineum]